MTFNAIDPTKALTNYARQSNPLVTPFHLGVNLGDQSPFLLPPEQISVHMAIRGIGFGEIATDRETGPNIRIVLRASWIPPARRPPLRWII